MVKLITADEAAALVADGANVAISGGGYRVTPATLVDALARRFLDTGAPRDITAIAVAMIEQARGGRGGAGTGLNRIAIPGLMARVITSSFSRSASNELNVAIRDNTAAAYNVPMGTLVQLLRAIAAGTARLRDPRRDRHLRRSARARRQDQRGRDR